MFGRLWWKYERGWQGLTVAGLLCQKCAFSFILRADVGDRLKFKRALISTLEEYVCRDNPTPRKACALCGAALGFKVGLTNL
jgi:hypothetical protein